MQRNATEILGVYREEVFCPGKVKEDRTVLDTTLEELRGLGYKASAIAPERLGEISGEPKFVLSMAQSHRSLNILAWWHIRGSSIINSVSSVRTCYRAPLFDRLYQIGMPIPYSRILPVRDAYAKLRSSVFRPFWLKRADVHAVEAGDVAKVTSLEELKNALSHFRSRRIDYVLAQDHVEGEVIKFYGVGPGSYFAAFGSAETGQRVPKLNSLWEVAEKAAAGIGLEVYGGDAVLDSAGRFHLIDINDWPSFSVCCKEATKAIALHSTGFLNGAEL